MTPPGRTLLNAWFPEKGMELLRPQRVGGSLKVTRDLESGQFEIVAHILVGGHAIAVSGFGHTSREALESWCIGAETAYRMAMAKAGVLVPPIDEDGG